MRVIVVEDSRVVQAYLVACLRGIAEVEVVAVIADGHEAVRVAVEQRPDVVFMDIELPGQDGIAATRQIMQQAPCPIVVLSAHLDGANATRPFEALAAGAVDVLRKPEGAALSDVGALRERLERSLLSIARARPRRISGVRHERAHVDGGPVDVVAIACSTGGPAALHTLLEALPAPYPRPILIAQHIEPGFEEGLCRWLRSTGHDVRVAAAGMPADAPGVWVLPAHTNSVVGPDGRFATYNGGPAQPRPSGDLLLASVAQRWGARAIGLVLTGMGRDGAAGLLVMRNAGAQTAVQDRSSCIVFGMPSAALANGGAVRALAPVELARWLAAALGSDEEAGR